MAWSVTWPSVTTSGQSQHGSHSEFQLKRRLKSITSHQRWEILCCVLPLTIYRTVKGAKLSVFSLRRPFLPGEWKKVVCIMNHVFQITWINSMLQGNKRTACCKCSKNESESTHQKMIINKWFENCFFMYKRPQEQVINLTQYWSKHSWIQ